MAPRPELLLDALVARSLTVATAESLTGGALCSALVDVPGASRAVRGGVIAYTVLMKERLLGVDPEAIERDGVVSEAVATAMARGVCEATGASLGLATTGVAGPEAHGGLPPGTVCVAAWSPMAQVARTLTVDGGREQVREAAVAAALDAGLAALGVTPV